MVGAVANDQRVEALTRCRSIRNVHATSHCKPK